MRREERSYLGKVKRNKLFFLLVLVLFVCLCQGVMRILTKQRDLETRSTSSRVLVVVWKIGKGASGRKMKRVERQSSFLFVHTTQLSLK